MVQLKTTFVGENLLSKTQNGCTICLTKYIADAGFEEWHAHQNASISFLLNGLHDEDFLGKKYKRIAGDVKFIPAGELHRCNNYTDARKINIDLSHTLLKDMEVSPDKIMHLLDDPLRMKITLMKLYHEVHGPADPNHASFQLLLYELLHPTHKKLATAGKDLPKWAIQLKQILQDEWYMTFELNDLAKRTGVHPVTISRYFPVLFSITLSDYVKKIKIDKALSLIKATKLSFTEIAYRCGFADQAHFTRSFKTYTGFLPKEFRKI